GPEKPSKKSGKGSPWSMDCRPPSSTAMETTAGDAFLTSSERAGRLPDAAEEDLASATSAGDRSVQRGPSKESKVGAAIPANTSRTAAFSAAMHHPLSVEDVHGRHARAPAQRAP